MKISQSFTFSAAHLIPGHLTCGVVHGHTFKVETVISGKLDPETGMVMDFHQLRQILDSIRGQLDHKFLNEVIEVPTAENICLYIRKKLFRGLEKTGVSLLRVRVYESSDSYAEY